MNSFKTETPSPLLSNIKWDFILLCRRIRHFGLNPTLGFFLILSALLLPAFFWGKLKYFAPIYFCEGLLFLLPLCNRNRCDFMQNLFSKRDYFLIRWVENMLVITPFAIVFLIYHEYVFPSILVVATAVSLLFSPKKFFFVFPSPFLKSSFEFLLGFRYSFFLVFGLYFLCFMAASHLNIALGIVDLLLFFVMFMGYYFYAEPDYYVWTHRLTPSDFLNNKMAQAALNAILLTIAPALFLCFSFPKNIVAVLYFFIHGFCCLFCSIVLKYRKYPSPMNIGEEILLVLTIICPTLPLILLFSIRKKTCNNLSDYL